MDLKMSSLIANGLVVNGTATVWTNNFAMGHSKNFTAGIVCATATSPLLRVQLEVSFQALTVGGLTNFNQGATSIYYAVPDLFPDIFSNINDTNYHYKGYQPPFAAYGRYKITGLTGNPADTAVTLYNMVQELGRTFGA